MWTYLFLCKSIYSHRQVFAYNQIVYGICMKLYMQNIYVAFFGSGEHPGAQTHPGKYLDLLAPQRNYVESHHQPGLTGCHGPPCAGSEVLLGSTWLFGCEWPSRARGATSNPDETGVSHWSCCWPRQGGNGADAARCWSCHESHEFCQESTRSTITNPNRTDLQRQFVLLRFLSWKPGREGCSFAAAWSTWCLQAAEKLPFWLTLTAGILQLWWRSRVF